MTFLPRIDNVRKEWSVQDFIVHKVLGESFDIPLIVLPLDQLVMKIKRYDDVFWVSSDIHHLVILSFHYDATVR